MVKKIAVVMCLCLLIAETSAAKQNYPTAGVSAHMAAVLYNAWRDEYKPPPHQRRGGLTRKTDYCGARVLCRG